MKKITIFNSGQSLVELMIGLAVLSIALTAILSLTTKSIQLTEVAELRKQAVNLARTKIEEIKKARDFTPDWATFKQAAFQEPYTKADAVVVKGTTFAWTSAVKTSAKDVTGEGVVLDVNVTVNWTDVNGQHTVDEYTILTKWR